MCMSVGRQLCEAQSFLSCTSAVLHTHTAQPALRPNSSGIRLLSSSNSLKIQCGKQIGAPPHPDQNACHGCILPDFCGLSKSSTLLIYRCSQSSQVQCRDCPGSGRSAARGNCEFAPSVAGSRPQAPSDESYLETEAGQAVLSGGHEFYEDGWWGRGERGPLVLPSRPESSSFLHANPLPPSADAILLLGPPPPPLRLPPS